jgi:hypothetical protein
MIVCKTIFAKNILPEIAKKGGKKWQKKDIASSVRV